MIDIYQILQKYADDSTLEVVTYNRDYLKICLTIDVEAGEKYSLIIPTPLHLDMPPKIMLGNIVFGKKELLPDNYAEFRNRGYEGDEVLWRVMRITDDEENLFFAIYYHDNHESFEML
jgi:hypothetical protein